MKTYDMRLRINVPDSASARIVHDALERYVRTAGWEPVSAQTAQRQDITVVRTAFNKLVEMLQVRISTHNQKLSIPAIRDVSLAILAQMVGNNDTKEQQ